VIAAGGPFVPGIVAAEVAATGSLVVVVVVASVAVELVDPGGQLLAVNPLVSPLLHELPDPVGGVPVVAVVALRAVLAGDQMGP